MRRLAWGIIGIGNIAQGTIAPAMLAEPECELVACVSRDQGRAEDFATRFQARFAYVDYDQMLANPEVEAVFIATPNAQHAGQVMAAAAAGKHVFCDKPLANNAADASAAVRACAEAGVHLGINFHNRHLPWVRDVTGIIAGGLIGKPMVVHVEVGSGPRHWRGWRADPDAAGLGSVHNVGVHALDFLRVLLDSEPVEVVAMFDNPPGSSSVEMLATILIRFDNGAVAYCNCNESVPYPRNDITIYGSDGRVVGSGLTRSREAGDLVLLTGRGEERNHYPAFEAHRAALAAFTSSVLNDEPPSPSGLDGVRSAQLCEAIARSVAERRVVEVASS